MAKAQATEVRSFALPTYITVPMAILRKLAPYWAFRFSLYLFFKPINFPVPERELPFCRKAKKHRLQAQEHSFIVWEWAPEPPQETRGTIVFIHGWSGRGSQGFKIAEKVHEQGYRFLAIDAPAHGSSPGKKGNLLYFVEALKTVGQKWDNIKLSIGHSLGGMAILNALHEGYLSDKIAVMGSPANVTNVIGDFCERVKAGPAVAQRIINYLEKSFNRRLAEVSTDYLAARHNPPGLIVHDEKDRDVPYINARQLNEAWPAAELHTTQSLGHRRILMDKRVLDKLMLLLQN